MNRLPVWLCVALLWLGNASVGSAFTHHDESVDGDLSGAAPPTFNLVAGSNLVLGRLPGTPASDTSDPFTMVLPAGLEILSIDVTYRSLQNGEELNLGLSFNGSLADDGFPGTVTTSGVSATFQDTVPPITGLLDPTLAGSQWRFDINSGTLFTSLDWTATIVVVPEPSTAALLGVAAALSAWIRRRPRWSEDRTGPRRVRSQEAKTAF